ncbi:MAG: DUF4124 domain-containing protein [Gammaproteobacteria bacterium]|nr:DUF4124 domain-containing protein [Gammaproteobacteria bacterium]
MLRFVLSALTAIIISSSFVAQAKMYKWADENGQIHFGDKIPPKYVVKEHVELNEQGVIIRRQDAAKTPAQKAEARRLRKVLAEKALIEKKAKQRDRVLLDTYTTERDLFVARDARLDAVGAQIRLASSIIEDSKNKLETMEKQVVFIETSNRQVPADLYRRIRNGKQQVAVQTRVMKNHKRRRDNISTQFNDYIERFRTLKAEQKARREQLARERHEF